MPSLHSALALLPALALTASLAACGGDSDPAPAPLADPTVESAAPLDEPSPTAEATAAAAAGAVAVGQTITDDVLGHQIVVKSVVRDFPVPARLSAIQDREIVLVEVEVTAGEEFSSVVSSSSFRILDPAGTENTASGVADEEVKAAGYEVYADVRTGETGSGWIAFIVDPADSPSLELRYKRGAAGVIGSGDTIEAKDFDVPLA